MTQTLTIDRRRFTILEKKITHGEETPQLFLPLSEQFHLSEGSDIEIVCEGTMVKIVALLQGCDFGSTHKGATIQNVLTLKVIPPRKKTPPTPSRGL